VAPYFVVVVTVVVVTVIGILRKLLGRLEQRIVLTQRRDEEHNAQQGQQANRQQQPGIAGRLFVLPKVVGNLRLQSPRSRHRWRLRFSRSHRTSRSGLAVVAMRMCRVCGDGPLMVGQSVDAGPQMVWHFGVLVEDFGQDLVAGGNFCQVHIRLQADLFKVGNPLGRHRAIEVFGHGVGVEAHSAAIDLGSA
jgi:hypothetical protein